MGRAMRRRSRSIARPTALRRPCAVGLAGLRCRSGPLDPPYPTYRRHPRVLALSQTTPAGYERLHPLLRPDSVRV
jgi:hypothetical protein